MKVGIIHTSNKKKEKRYPVHARQLTELNPEHLHKIIFEEGYPGLETLPKDLVKTAKREDIFNEVDLVILHKPVPDDYLYFREHQILWGALHCVQTPSIVDLAINKKMTLIAFEQMLTPNEDGKDQSIFYRNREVAGVASVVHSLSLIGMTAGLYGNKKKVAVIGYGSTGKGAIKALLGLGAEQISVYSRRSRSQIKVDDSRLVFKKYHSENGRVTMEGKAPFEELSQYDIIVNCILQNPLKPIVFMTSQEALKIKKMLLIIDISCDAGMGFEFAKPTSFSEPLFNVGKVVYYGVDHSPSLFYRDASYEIGKAVMPYLKYILDHDTYRGNKILEQAVDIEEGVIKNREIITFQKR